MQNGIGDGGTYLIADAEYVSINDLVRRVGRALGIDVKLRHYPLPPLIAAGHLCEALCKPLGITPPLFPRRVDWYRQNRAFRIERAEQELGYRPRVGLDEGLRSTAEWYRREGLL
jgi:nucleoside-diphosphate-sugar epimerase